MDFRVTLEDIRELVAKASVTTSSKDTMAVLKNFRLEVGSHERDIIGEGGEVIGVQEEKRLTITGTDLELTYQGSIPCVGSDGTILVDASKFSYILSRIEGDDVTVVRVGNKIELSAGAARFTLVVIAPDEYPPIELFDHFSSAAQPFMLKREMFLENMRKVTHAMCSDEIRANLMAVSVKQSEMIAADGKRLAIARLPQGSVAQDVDIPASAVTNLTKLMGLLNPDALTSSRDDMMTIQRTDEYLHFEYGYDLFSVRAGIAGFPNVQKQVEKTEGNSIEVMLDADHLTRILRRVAVSADDETSSVRIDINPSEVVFTTQDEVGNRSVEKVSLEQQPGGFTSYFNYKFLLQSLTVLDRKQVSLRFAPDENGRPLPLRIDEDAYTEIILAEHGDF